MNERRRFMYGGHIRIGKEAVMAYFKVL